MRLLLYLLLITVFISCKESDNDEIKNSLTVTVSPGITNAYVSWNLSTYDTSLVYSIYLDNTLQKEDIREKYYDLRNLKKQTSYSGKIVASDKKGHSIESNFSFSTLTPGSPSAFKINSEFITSDSLGISWTKSVDPQQSPVYYDIYINGKVVQENCNQLVYSFGNLSSATKYHIEVIAKDSFNARTSSIVDLKTLSVNAHMIHKNETCQGFDREYGYYLPSEMTDINYSLVIYLHGAGGNAWDELSYIQLKDIAEREKFVLAMPQALNGTTSDGTYIQWNAHEVLAWDDAFFINSMIDSLCKHYKINTKKIYVCGMSNGGFMTFYAASRINKFAAIAAMSGLMSYNIYNKYKTEWPMPLLYIHGTADNIVPYDGLSWMASVDKVLNLWITKNGCNKVPAITELPDKVKTDGSTVTFLHYEGESLKSEICFYRINGGDHSIPGYEPGANQDIKAFELIWSFFKTKSK